MYAPWNASPAPALPVPFPDDDPEGNVLLPGRAGGARRGRGAGGGRQALRGGGEGGGHRRVPQGQGKVQLHQPRRRLDEQRHVQVRVC